MALLTLSDALYGASAMAVNELNHNSFAQKTVAEPHFFIAEERRKGTESGS